MDEVLCLLHIDVVAFDSTSHGQILMVDGELWWVLAVVQLSVVMVVVVVVVVWDQCSVSDVSLDYLHD